MIIFSNTMEEQLKRLDKVLQRLKDCNLKLNPKKCKFLQTKVNFVCHIVSENGVEQIQKNLRKLETGPYQRLQKKFTNLHHLQVIIAGLLKIFRKLPNLLQNYIQILQPRMVRR